MNESRTIPGGIVNKNSPSNEGDMDSPFPRTLVQEDSTCCTA